MKMIQKFFNLFGYKSVNFERAKNLEAKNTFNYESILFRRYAPWEDDKEFESIYNAVRNHTLVDIYRLFELYSLARQARELEGAVLEVGAWRGGSSVVLAKAFSDLENKPDFYCCDTFAGVANATYEDKDYRGGEHSDTSVETVSDLFQENGVEFIKIVKGIFPEEAAARIDLKKVRFCHIDVDVYKSAKQIFEYIWPLVVINGVVVFDDYGFISCNGVTKLVNELNLSDSKFIYNLNGHAIFIKTK